MMSTSVVSLTKLNSWILALTVGIVCLPVPHAFAAGPVSKQSPAMEKQQLVEQYISVRQLRGRYTNFVQHAVQAGKGTLLINTEADVKRVRDFIMSRVNWNNFYMSFKDHYSRVYSVEELRQMVAFFSTPVGQKLAQDEDAYVTQLFREQVTQFVKSNDFKNFMRDNGVKRTTPAQQKK